MTAYDLSAFENLSPRPGQPTTVTLTPEPVAQLAAVLGIDPPAVDPGDPVPAGWHDVFFRGGAPRRDRLRTDGTPKRRGGLPENPLPFQRITWDRNRFPGVLKLGDTATRTPSVASVAVGGTDDAPTLTVVNRNEIAGPDGPAVIEEREFVYHVVRSEPGPEPDDLPEPVWTRTLEPDPILLFCFSALRMNAHRVHYDRRYITEVEGAPGLVVHGSLISLLLHNMAAEEMPDRRIVAFHRETLRGAYDTGPVTLYGAPSADGSSARIWARDSDARLCSVGTVDFA